MLYSVEDLLSKDSSMSAMILIDFQIDMTELHSAKYSGQICSCCSLWQLYCRLYAFSYTCTQFISIIFAKLPREQNIVLFATNHYDTFISIPVALVT